MLVDRALRGLNRLKERPTKLMHKSIDPEVAYRHLAGAEHVYIVDGYLVYFEVHSPWYSNVTILSELLLVRVEEGGTLAGVAHFLREKARAAGADILAVGTALAKSDRALSRLYQAEGFTPEAITLTTEP